MDYPISCDEYAEADGLYLSDDTTLVGIEGRNMQNYTPLVRVEEVSSDPYIFEKMDALQKQIDVIHSYQTEESILKSTLNEAYKSGVNAI